MAQINHCAQWLGQQNRPRPRTCAICGLGPCQRGYANWGPPSPDPAPAPVDPEVLQSAVLYDVLSSYLPTRAQAIDAVKTLIRFIGDDDTRPGLVETPERFLRAWLDEWGRGYSENPISLVKLFKEPAQTFDEIVIVRKVQWWSHCEHHLAPFFGEADIGYLPNPNAGIIGLSKIPRILEHFARRLQVQERIGVQVADFLMERTAALGVGVILRARHLCMCSRGVAQDDAETVTSTMRGVFFTNPTARAEFLQLTRG